MRALGSGSLPILYSDFVRFWGPGTAWSVIKLALVPLLALMLSACSIGGVLAGLTPGGGEVRKGLAYGDHPRQRLDLYFPETGSASGALVVFFYGGSWNSGSRDFYAFVGKALAARGHMVAIPDYRLYPEVRYPAFLEDSAAAVQWLRTRADDFDIGLDRLVLAGHSAGAYNAAMLAFAPQWLASSANPDPALPLAGFVGLAGPYDFMPIRNPDVQPVFFHPNYPQNSQPIHLLNGSAPPSFFGVAPDDELVNPKRNSAQMVEKLRALGVPAELREYERTNHMTVVGSVSGPLRWLAPVLDDIARFIGSTTVNSQ